jgi:hypothetical protein
MSTRINIPISKFGNVPSTGKVILKENLIPTVLC